MKRIIAVSALFLVCLCSGAVAACAPSEEEEFQGDSVEIDLALRPGESGATLEWPTEKGVLYDVYRAPSRYGNYERVATADGSYSDGERYCYYRVSARTKSGKLLGVSNTVGEEAELFGENVMIFAPTDDPSEVRSALSSRYREMERAHFTQKRYAVFFKAGNYGDSIALNVPFFTTFAGLGPSPDDTSLGSLICEGDWNTNSLINFWRGVENLSFAKNCKWAVSQGTFLRGVHIQGDLALHDDYMMASGGFLADSVVDGTIDSGSQQQWFTRNTKMGGWQGSVWNMVFAGVENAPTGDKFTSVDELPVLREKPILVFDEEGYALKIPALSGDPVLSREIYFARAERDTAESINERIAAGKNIVFLPGVYALDRPIEVGRAGTVLCGIGLATLFSANGNCCVEIGDVDGVEVSGLLFDAGPKATDALMRVGKTSAAHETDPIFLYDCFFRVGGNAEENTYAEISLEINASDVVTDNVWLWRADHGSGVGWEKNNGDYGAVIRGDRVKCYGLFAEHYKKNNVLWTGNDGYVVFYQSELAYDVPSAEAWRSEFGRGYPSFAVTDGVETFAAYGLGIYSNFQTEGIELDCAMRLPAGKGIYVRYLCGFAMSAKGKVYNLIDRDGLFFDQSDVGAGTNFRWVDEYRG